MSNKKHQREPTGAGLSSDSEDENQTNAECSHINKAVDLTSVKKIVNKHGFLAECSECKRLPVDPELAELEMELDLTLWLCLKCGHQACGRGKCKHALQHYNVPHSDSHSLCVNTTIWSIWCYDCDNDVNISCKRKLLDAVEYLKKHAEYLRSKQQVYTSKISEVMSTLPVINSNNDTGTLPKNPTLCTPGLPRPRGLKNLGNTCFFNSVMQCLGQTPYLVTLLDDTASAGQLFQLPGGTLKMKGKDNVLLPPLEGETEKWRPLPQTLTETLRELQSGRSDVFIPKSLLQKLIFRMPQFGGGDQHDSHELLRHLLEAVREEDQRRFKAVILEKLGEFYGFNTKTNPSTVDDEKKHILKFYGQQVSEMLLATEQVFRGALVSTLQCQVCDHMSHMEEKFLDLSLPISEKQIAPVLRRKADDSEDNKPSKHQIKKEKRAEKKKKKQKYNRNNNLLITNMNDTDVAMEHKSSSEESDADVEDNAEDSCNNTIIALPAPGEDSSSKGGESGYNSDKIDNGSPDSNCINSPSACNLADSGVPSPTTAAPAIPNSPNNMSVTSETNTDMAQFTFASDSSENDCDKNKDTFDRAVSRLAFVENNNKNIDLKVDLEKLSLLNDGDSSKVIAPIEQSQMLEEGACAMETSSELMDQDEDYSEEIALYGSTLAPRYQCEEGECSVESCLNQFTECELMMGSNKVSCDMCTKRSGNQKTVNTDASKQLLIYNPPAVLILHLKRFQVFRFRSTKVSKFVKFSTLLDLGPFCSKRSQSLPTVDAGQTEVLYSLYGVVEHSGSIHGGHYVSYVKVRAPLDENSPRWHFIPKNQKELLKNNQQGVTEKPEPPAGKWYYISDSYVSEVAESKVLSAQAYILFYERLS
ncbi:ubiquitin carboxyl-terminal hydrolase 45 isoform X1 [Dendroctonus ponderosae]|uniref:Ubiquitin carboxyl-terminal hydrolase n=1 Tax=Dendroctonus ponderosae TaxID=77166 RepID=A0AAR5PXQ4_DENPD|nr:ubiquitin carboxyl-terminal hydrolase 45 isoform X1 [Dendroctonus ponderosae]